MATASAPSPSNEGIGGLTRLQRASGRLVFRGISGFLIRRIFLGALTLALVSIIIFAATQALPSDPAKALLGRTATPDSLKALREQLHLNRPVIDQYGSWVKGMVTLKPGTSIASGQSVSTVVGPALVNSSFLVLISALVSIPLALGIGILAAVRRDRIFDNASSLVLLTLAALPEFVAGIALVLLLGTVVFTWLPPDALIPPGDRPWNHMRELVLPVATLAIAVVPYIARFMRASLIEVLESDYVEMARLKGLPEREVVFRHALPNAIVPSIQAIALTLVYLAGGIVAVEFVFSYPGIGAKLVGAVANRDMPVSQTVSLLIATTYVVVNLLADVVTILVSPRVRTSL
jgi:peptide/nickel transport system permease protein